jgi:hypothetical protein
MGSWRTSRAMQSATWQTSAIADVRIAGRSTFSMSSDFELVDGVRVPRFD